MTRDYYSPLGLLLAPLVVVFWVVLTALAVAYTLAHWAWHACLFLSMVPARVFYRAGEGRRD